MAQKIFVSSLGGEKHFLESQTVQLCFAWIHDLHNPKKKNSHKIMFETFLDVYKPGVAWLYTHKIYLLLAQNRTNIVAVTLFLVSSILSRIIGIF